MAEPSAATQSPSVSSSSSGADPSAPGACPAPGAKSCGSSCADSFVSSSSSQPVSLFSTSQEGLSSLCSNEPPTETVASSSLSSKVHKTDIITPQEDSQPVSAKDLALLDGKDKGAPRGLTSPASGAAGDGYNRTSIPAAFPDHTAFLSKDIGQVEQQTNKDQESEDPNEMLPKTDTTTLGAEDKLTLPAAQKPPTVLPKAAGVTPNSLSPSKVSGDSLEKDSPESPFEVIIDKATFDKEFKDAYKESRNDFGSWAAHTDSGRESPTDLLESNDKLFPLRNREAGRYPSCALLSRQFSHTAAALEEVSRCVSDMHNFTNEVLTWDLVPQVKQLGDKYDHISRVAGLDRSCYDSDIPVVDLKASTRQKIPACSSNGSAPITKPLTETALTQQNTVIKTPVADATNCSKEIIKGARSCLQKQDGMLAERLGSPVDTSVPLDSGVAALKMALPSDPLNGEVHWQSSVLGGGTEADSSGESDDTVIEDITANSPFESNKIQAENHVSVPSVVVKTGEKEVHCNGEDGTSSEGSVSDSEPQPVHPDVLKRSPAGELALSRVPGMGVNSEDVKQHEVLREIASEKSTVTKNSESLSAASPDGFSETNSSLKVTPSAYVELLHDENIKDIDDSSPEDLIPAFTESQESATDRSEGNASGDMTEKSTDSKISLPVDVSHEDEVGDFEMKHTEENKQTSGSQFLDDIPGAPVASLDLEQEQLTIRALKELSERQNEKSPSAQDKADSPEEVLKHTFTFAPESSWTRRSYAVPEYQMVNPESVLEISRKPTAVKETAEIGISDLSKTELVNKHVLARLLTDFSVHDLIFWRDVKKTGFVFGGTLVTLLSLAAFSVISVVSYLILALLSVTISFRVYKSVIQAVQKSEEGHPFKAYLDVDITLSSEAFHNYVNAAMVHINKALKLIIRLFLVEDLVDSLKLAVFMWLMTYVGAVFNGITLLILADLLVFSVPIVYEKYKTQIDHYVGIARDQTKSIVEKIQAKLPGIVKKKAE